MASARMSEGMNAEWARLFPGTDPRSQYQQRRLGRRSPVRRGETDLPTVMSTLLGR
jgi:hypothetical protein